MPGSLGGPEPLTNGENGSRVLTARLGQNPGSCTVDLQRAAIKHLRETRSHLEHVASRLLCP